MPYNAAQMRLFRAAAHDPKIARSAGIPRATAARLMREGMKAKGKGKGKGKA